MGGRETKQEGTVALQGKPPILYLLKFALKQILHRQRGLISVLMLKSLQIDLAKRLIGFLKLPSNKMNITYVFMTLNQMMERKSQTHQ